jgi:hypothetical protein
LVATSLPLVAEEDPQIDTFVPAFFYSLHSVPLRFYSLGTIACLRDIATCIPLRLHTASYILYSADTWINLDPELYSQFWSFVGQLAIMTAQESRKSSHIKIVKDLIQYALRVTESKEDICCKKHIPLDVPHSGDHNYTNLALTIEPIIQIVQKIFLTGGNSPRLTEQIQYLGQVLTSKTQPCFKLQILKLLKVLLVDSKQETFCDSPQNYADQFFKVDGVKILLYLCTNSPLDIKSMSMKLIDALSSY